MGNKQKGMQEHKKISAGKWKKDKNQPIPRPRLNKIRV